MSEHSEFKPTVYHSPEGGSTGGTVKRKSRIEGSNGEKWASWLIKEAEDVEGISSEDLKIEIRLLARRPDTMAGPEVLEKSYSRIEELLKEGKIEDKEVSVWLERIGRRHELLQAKSMGETKEDLGTADLLEVIRQFGRVPEKMARAMGQLPPERVLEAFRKAEENMLPFEIGPATEPPFYVLYETEDELERQRKIWDARSTLVQAAAIKLNASSIEDLIDNDKMSIELNKIRLETLFSLTGVIPATAIYTRIIGGKKFREDNPPNLKEVLLGKEGYIRNLKLPEEEKKTLLKEQKELRGSCPESVWAEETNQETFSEIRKSIRFWLKTKGHHFLFQNKEEMQQIAEKGNTSMVAEERARDAEQVAWNLVFTAGLIESFNSKGYRRIETGKGYQGPSNFMTLYLWMLMHPQERFEAKVFGYRELKEKRIEKKGETVKYYVPTTKEEWSAFGTWAIQNIRNKKWPTKRIEKKTRDPKDSKKTVKKVYEQLQVPRIFKGSELIKDAFRQDLFFFTFFNKKGKDLLDDPGEFKDAGQLMSELFTGDGWQDLGDAPFVNYRFNSFRWANTVFAVFKKGSVAEAKGEVSMEKLSEAIRMLNLPKKDRENLLIALKGVNPKSSSIKSMMSEWDFQLYKEELKRWHPTYWEFNPQEKEH